ncbi:MAG: cation transporter [Bacteroidales bacterium]|nr:cation transporter [Bacteroidales bacterium]
MHNHNHSEEEIHNHAEEHHHHTHNHSHHHHNHAVDADSLNKAFVLGIILNSLFVVCEFAAGFVFNSVGLMSDAGHNLSDVASLILAMMAFRIAKIPHNDRFTYGYKKITVHVSLINAVILIVAVAFIVYESVHKLLTMEHVEGGMISITAAIGVVINALTAWLFLKDKEKDLNVKGAYLHMAADALVSLGVVVSGIVIMYTGWYFIDGIIGLAVACIIVWSTFELLNESVRLSLDGVPHGISCHDITDGLKQTENVAGVHHVHIWALSTTENALTAHVCLDDFSLLEQTKHDIKQYLKSHNITHSTLEFEHCGIECSDSDCDCKD